MKPSSLKIQKLELVLAKDDDDFNMKSLFLEFKYVIFILVLL